MTDITIPYEELVDLLDSIFCHAGVRAESSSILAKNCASCERDGALSHGVFRIPGYLGSLSSGWVDGQAEPVIEVDGPAFVRVDAANGFAQPALEKARSVVEAKARRNGVAVLAIRNSHHFSALWPDVEGFAQNGLIALSMVNSMACTVPFDGTKAIVGTNPIAFATPVEGDLPLVADMATSAMANGDVQIASQKGLSIPPNHGVDRNGEPTTDADAVLDGGALLTFGGYKGSSISLMIELLCAALTGGKFSFEVDWSAHPGAQTPHTGQLIIVIDPDFGRVNSFSSRAALLLQELERAGVSRLPGQRRHKQREVSLRDGIQMKSDQLKKLRDYASVSMLKAASA
ncbi:Ldh family oxidoreductase [Cohaesibacter marisflavi]|uniref:Ldh family oxidoreductase n=1 Tax=Cohaesibacter marisflavi TaxID=655353 RepID=UPI0029C750E4|nr:Ldh family oxidoreductase [Cohaesibacter marisflavi]